MAKLMRFFNFKLIVVFYNFVKLYCYKIILKNDCFCRKTIDFEPKMWEN